MWTHHIQFILDLAERYVQADESKAKSLEYMQYLPDAVEEMGRQIAVAIEQVSENTRDNDS